MARFYFSSMERDIQVEISLADFLELTLGSSLKTAASGDDFFEYGTSDKLNINFGKDEDGEMSVICFYTLNNDEIAPLRINIFDGEGPLTALDLERRIFSLRQLYALSYLAREDMLELAYENLIAGHRDLEQMLIPAEEQLVVSAANAGSFWLTIIPKSKKMAMDVLGTAAAIYPRGREALLRRVELMTEFRGLEVEHKANQNKVDLAKGLISVAKEIDKIKDTEMKAVLRQEYLHNIAVTKAELTPTSMRLENPSQLAVPPRPEETTLPKLSQEPRKRSPRRPSRQAR